MINTEPEEFKKFHALLTKDNPDYVPFYFPLNPNSKDPLEGKSWKENRQTYGQAIKWLEHGYNIAIAATDKDALIIMDKDDLAKVGETKPTLTNISRKRIGQHSFYFATDKVPHDIFEDSAKQNIATEDAGEIRSNWQYVVCAGSYVPVTEEELDKIPENDRVNAGRYTVFSELPVVTITYDELPDVYKQYLQEKREAEIAAQLQKKSKSTPITRETEPKQAKSALFSLTIEDVVGMHADPHKRFPSLFHASDTGKNTSISRGLLHCWRHNVSHTPLTALAAMAGISDCSHAGYGHRGSGASELNLQDGQTIYKLWEYAKKNGLIPENDPIPSVALAWYAFFNQVCTQDEIKDDWKLPAEAYNKAIQKISDSGINHGREPLREKSDSDESNEKPKILEVDSIDEIPLPQEDIIPPISFAGLPDYNFIKMYVDYIAKVSDSYPEYAFQNSIAILSALVRRRLYFRLNGRTEYTNLITLCLGQSGYARKSASMWTAQNILKDAVGDTFLSHDLTPEGLIAEIADTIETTVRTKNGSETKIEFQDSTKIRRALCALWKDEAGQFYAQLNKPHMQSAKELLCHLYDCPTAYNKRLSNKKFSINAVYLSMNLATTPASFYDAITTKDAHIGFIARHNIANPDYVKKRKDITEDSEADIQKEREFIIICKLLDSILPDAPLWIKVGNNCLTILNAWAKEREEYFAKERNEIMGSFFARFQINVLKIALLIELGNLPYYLYDYYIYSEDNSQVENTINIKINKIIRKNTQPVLQDYAHAICIVLQNNNNIICNYSISSLSISIHSLLYAIRLYDSMYLPYAYQFCVNSKVDVFANYLSTIYKILRDNKKIDYSLLLRNSHVSRADFQEAIETFKEAGAVKEYKVKGKTKPQRVFAYVPPAYSKFSFNPVFEPDIDDDATITLTRKDATQEGNCSHQARTQPPEEINIPSCASSCKPACQRNILSFKKAEESFEGSCDYCGETRWLDWKDDEGNRVCGTCSRGEIPDWLDKRPAESELKSEPESNKHGNLIHIPFNEWSLDKLERGIKTATSRTKKYGDVGDYFEAEGKRYVLTGVTKKSLKEVAERCYLAEGAQSHAEFREVWASIHKHRGFVPEWEVYFHEFKQVEDIHQPPHPIEQKEPEGSNNDTMQSKLRKLHPDFLVQAKAGRLNSLSKKEYDKGHIKSAFREYFIFIWPEYAQDKGKVDFAINIIEKERV